MAHRYQYLVGVLSPVNHKGLCQGKTDTNKEPLKILENNPSKAHPRVRTLAEFKEETIEVPTLFR